MKVVYSPECLGYRTPGHPESPERVKAAFEKLKSEGFSFAAAGPAAKEDVLLVHTAEHYERVRSKAYDSVETPPIDIRYPLLAAGATLKAAEVSGFALTRPPGHHAGKNSLEGFCYFNNIAIAVRKLGKRTAILDLDIHHGNGTQEIFMGEKDVLYVSVHQSPLYPMSGLRSEQNCQNFPVFPGTPEKDYLMTVEKAVQAVERFRPELLAVSMGFDTYEKDPLGGQQVTVGGFAKMGKLVNGLGLPVFIALEGGYSAAMGELCVSFLKEFG